MANAYSLATCILIVRRNTAVIQKLFGSVASKSVEAVDIDASAVPPGFQAFSFFLEDGDGLCDADPIFDSLRELSDSLGIADASELTDEAVLLRLCSHFQSPDHLVIDTLLEEADNGNVGIATLCALAKVLNDGHDLWSLSVQEGRWADRCVDGNFGGSAQYLGSHFAGSFGTSSSLSAARELQTALSENNLQAAAGVFAARLQGVLKAIQREDQRVAILAEVLPMLQPSLPAIPQRLVSVVLSTAHIPDEAPARDFLDQMGVSMEFGWLWKVPPRLAEVRDCLVLPAWLHPILAYADSNGIDRIEFDKDGDVIDDVPTYDW
ncbi:hypothetical protein [Achromobacter sp. GbtcB20]|uniref:DUF5983 family protein n=1 Tax=Achromobacter sp. GbtcB20 TaxID=2824765 RepID=UPI001266E1F2|nr:hypothetical protein [Achromobacter sp. GbtcB20]